MSPSPYQGEGERIFKRGEPLFDSSFLALSIRERDF
jgi:hypothetical protein